jgi:two-component system, OmpR family, response regulator QseB
MRVLLAETKDRDARQIALTLRRQGYAVDRVYDGLEAQLALTTTRYALVLINMVLPKMSGPSLLLWLRQINFEVPVLTFKQHDSAVDRVRALNAGSDDHLSKPFDVRELVARCHALVRRSQGRCTDQIRCRKLWVNAASQTALSNGRPVTMSPREWAVLLQLITHQDVPQSTSTLENAVYGWKDEIESNAIQVHISKLRKKLGSDMIRTVRGVGYVIDRE